ncbi:MAG: PP2C family protein-serine/threonine phosphatase [Spirochaetales bacterium]|nr:PP2C family protein-serine/threonine phosphatase [Spirochaetales bacterium]
MNRAVRSACACWRPPVRAAEPCFTRSAPAAPSAAAPTLPRLRCRASSFTPAQGVGGDFYLSRKITENDWVIMLCDVSGKGVAASIVTAMLYGITRTYDFKKGLKAFVKDLNALIFETFGGDRFLTGIFMLFNEETGKMIILDMGHSYLSLIREGRLVKISSDVDNLPIGISEDLTPRAGVMTLEYGDIIMTVTDGLVEQKNGKGEFYEMERMQHIVKVNSDCALEDIRDTVLADFEHFREETPYHDDMTFLLIRYPHPEEDDF